jgi:hypothetical protein
MGSCAVHREPPHRADALAEEETVTDLMGEGGAWDRAVEAKVMRAKVRGRGKR